VLTAAIRHGKEAVPIAYLLISPRPGADQLLFASTDPEVAEARGVPVGRLGLLFLLELALTVTGAAQVVGTPLVLSLAITPAAAAQRLSASPLVVTALSVVFAVVAADGGLLASFGAVNIKASVFITSISFAIYLAARLAGPLPRDRRQRRRQTGQVQPAERAYAATYPGRGTPAPPPRRPRAAEPPPPTSGRTAGPPRTRRACRSRGCS